MFETLHDIFRCSNHKDHFYCNPRDAVNTASRMESNSEANRINCSESAATILMKQWPELTLIDRGEIFIKGKGMMNCFWVHNKGVGPSVPEVNVTRVTITPLEEIPEQCPEPKKTHKVLAADDDFIDLESNLKNRLRRSGGSREFGLS